MKMAMFTTPKAYADHCERMADGIEQNGLKQAQEQLEKALQGIGREGWLKMNNISTEMADEMWKKHNEWLQDQVNYMKRKIRKYRREAQKALALV